MADVDDGRQRDEAAFIDALNSLGFATVAELESYIALHGQVELRPVTSHAESLLQDTQRSSQLDPSTHAHPNPRPTSPSRREVVHKQRKEQLANAVNELKVVKKELGHTKAQLDKEKDRAEGTSKDLQRVLDDNDDLRRKIVTLEQQLERVGVTVDVEHLLGEMDRLDALIAEREEAIDEWEAGYHEERSARETALAELAEAKAQKDDAEAHNERLMGEVEELRRRLAASGHVNAPRSTPPQQQSDARATPTPRSSSTVDQPSPDQPAPQPLSPPLATRPSPPAARPSPQPATLEVSPSAAPHLTPQQVTHAAYYPELVRHYRKTLGELKTNQTWLSACHEFLPRHPELIAVLPPAPSVISLGEDDFPDYPDLDPREDQHKIDAYYGDAKSKRDQLYNKLHEVRRFKELFHQAQKKARANGTPGSTPVVVKKLRKVNGGTTESASPAGGSKGATPGRHAASPRRSPRKHSAAPAPASTATSRVPPSPSRAPPQPTPANAPLPADEVFHFNTPGRSKRHKRVTELSSTARPRPSPPSSTATIRAPPPLAPPPQIQPSIFDTPAPLLPPSSGSSSDLPPEPDTQEDEPSLKRSEALAVDTARPSSPAQPPAPTSTPIVASSPVAGPSSSQSRRPVQNQNRRGSRSSQSQAQRPPPVPLPESETDVFCPFPSAQVPRATTPDVDEVEMEDQKPVLSPSPNGRKKVKKLTRRAGKAVKSDGEADFEAFSGFGLALTPPDPAADWEAVRKREERLKRRNGLVEVDDAGTSGTAAGSSRKRSRGGDLEDDEDEDREEAQRSEKKRSKKENVEGSAKKGKSSRRREREVSTDEEVAMGPQEGDKDGLEWMSKVHAKRNREAEAIRAERAQNSARKKGLQVELDPRKNGGESHHYSEVVRSKKEREKMVATTCQDCEAWYERTGSRVACAHAAKAAAAKGKGKTKDSFLKTRHDEMEKQRRVQEASRHRYQQRPDPSPPDFWQMGFPTTQKVEEINKKAALNREETRLYRESEAEMGGRYRFKHA
ncbi:retinoblastoma-binding protein 8 [Pseudohyphozyma bogoriensis]|nr:retinoblastoma-binding protein 8 [Pseudohyphozyma bogoriensis]